MVITDIVDTEKVVQKWLFEKVFLLPETSYQIDILKVSFHLFWAKHEKLTSIECDNSTMRKRPDDFLCVIGNIVLPRIQKWIISTFVNCRVNLGITNLRLKDPCNVLGEDDIAIQKENLLIVNGKWKTKDMKLVHWGGNAIPWSLDLMIVNLYLFKFTT